jgi:organic hydroperoxide reductase OsmC/OhrA
VSGTVPTVEVDPPSFSAAAEWVAVAAWRGATGSGHAGYDRTHRGSAVPAEQELSLSFDPAFRGDPALLNPEQVVLIAASSCQLLSFLAVAARAGVDVRAYDDEASAVMPEGADPARITHIHLKPRIEVAGEGMEQRVRRLVEQAHEQCYVANSLRPEVQVEPTIVFVEGDPRGTG